MIYYDFETLASECNAPSKTWKLERVSKHVPISIAAKRVCILLKHDGDLFTYTGEDCVKKFMEYLDCQANEIDCITDRYCYPIDWSECALKRFYKQKSCSICGAKFRNEVRKVRTIFTWQQKITSGDDFALQILIRYAHALLSYVD